MTQPAIALNHKNATYADYCAVPDHFFAELIDGELIVSPWQAIPHAFACTGISADVAGSYGRGRKTGGWWILPKMELHMGLPDPKSRVLVPDLAGWRRERMPRIPTTAAFTQVPDWVAEVLSPKRKAHDRIRKADIYAGLGPEDSSEGPAET